MANHPNRMPLTYDLTAGLHRGGERAGFARVKLSFARRHSYVFAIVGTIDGCPLPGAPQGIAAKARWAFATLHADGWYRGRERLDPEWQRTISARFARAGELPPLADVDLSWAAS